MTTKQQRRLAKNRDSQRLALHEHMTSGAYASSKGLAVHVPAMASRRIASDRPFNAHLRLPKRAA